MGRLEPENREEYAEIYSQYEESGFEFVRANGHLSKSKVIFKEKLRVLEDGKSNQDEVPMVVYCDDCNVYMDYYSESKDMLGVYICPSCKRRVNELTLCNKLERENDLYLDSIGKPKLCKNCGGPWPDCSESCKILD